MYILDVYFITLNCCKKSKNFNSCIAILKQDKNVFLLAVYNETTEAKLNSKMATIDNQVLWWLGHFLHSVIFSIQIGSVKTMDEMTMSRSRSLVELTGDFGVVSSQDYPAPYPPTWSQSFKIISRPNARIVVKFQVRDGEIETDCLKLVQGFGEFSQVNLMEVLWHLLKNGPLLASFFFFFSSFQ